MTEDDLLDAIAETPNDDGPRLVYADWLQQQVDELARARGEYLALSRTTVRPRPSLRLQALLDRHEQGWLGPVARVTHARHWERGFLDRCALRYNPNLADLDGEARGWWMLRALDVDGATTVPVDRLAELLCHRSLGRLRSLRAHVALLQRIAESAHPPRLTELSSINVPAQLSEVLELLAADCFASLIKLHVFHIRPAMLTALRPGQILILNDRPQALALWLAALTDVRSPLAEVRLESTPSPVVFERRCMELVLHGTAGVWEHLEVRWVFDDDPRWRDELLAVLPQLPAGAIRGLSFVGPPNARFDIARFKQRVRTALPDVAVDG